MLFVAHSVTNQPFRKARHKPKTCRETSRHLWGLGWLLNSKDGQHHQMSYRHLDKSACHTLLRITDDVTKQMAQQHLTRA